MYTNNYHSKLYPLTHPQKRIWYIEKIYPNTSIYNIGGPIRIKGHIDFKLFEKAIITFIKKNKGLMHKFIQVDEEPFQYVDEFDINGIDFLDFSKFNEPEDEYGKWVEDESKKVFDLEGGVLFYFALFRISDNDNGYYVRFHHIISDGWSINIMTEQIYNIYTGFLLGETSVKADLSEYTDYIQQEQAYLASDRFLKDKMFWNEKFSCLPESLFDNNSERIAGKRKTFIVEQERTDRLREFTQKHKCSLNTFFVTVFLIYLYKVYQKEDIVIGTPVLNRSGRKEKKIFGMFTSTMPFRMNVDKQYSSQRFMDDVSRELMNCYFHQKYPYDLLTQDLQLKKKGYDELFQVCVNYYNTKLGNFLNGMAVENYESYSGNQAYSLQIVIKDWLDSGRLMLDFDYKTSQYTEELIDRMYNHLNNLIDQVLSDCSRKIGDLKLLTGEEREKIIYEFNATGTEYPGDKTISELFEEQVERTPGKVAVSFNGETLTYRELNEKSNQLAGILIGNGVNAESVVGLIVTHSLETVVSILGIIKAGGAYLPIDPGYPADRVNFMLKDSKVSALLTNCDIKDKIDFNGYILNLNHEHIYFGTASNPKMRSRPENLAYVIYTSGSTGKPKGVMVEHRGLVNYIWWAKSVYAKQDDEVFALYSSLSFDLTVTSVFTPLISGNTICIYNDDGEEYVLYKIMEDCKATVVKLTPSHLMLLKDRDNRNSSVRRFIVGGENLKVSLARDIYQSFQGKIEIYNEYGPTETVVGCMIHRFDIEKDIGTSVPIGVPADNVQVYILDKNLEPLPAGITGEMYISGDGVARGYLNRSDLTKERFLKNPFLLTGVSGPKLGRMYRTGDLARFIGDGTIEYIGRADNQVKIRGYRIELGEIEEHLMGIPGIRNAVVTDRCDSNGNVYLCAYLTASNKIPEKDIHEHLIKSLPEYMVPYHYVYMDEIPLTSNGKVNKILLPKPEFDVKKGHPCMLGTTPVEKSLIEALGQVLNIKSVRPDDNFYHLGGDSIKAIQVSAKLSHLGLKIRVKDILSHPLIGDMAVYIARNKEDLKEDYSICEGIAGDTPVALWFFEQGFSRIQHWNQSVLLKLHGNVDVDIINNAIDYLVRHHDALRLNYSPQNGKLYFNNAHISKKNELIVHDLSSYSEEEQMLKVKQIGGALKGSIDIENDRMLKTCIFDLGSSGKLLLLSAHHLVVDGVSWRVILEDMVNLYEQMLNGKPFKLPGKTCSIQYWSESLKKYGNGQALEEIDFWNEVIEKDFAFPYDKDMESKETCGSHTVNASLSVEETSVFLGEANRAYNTKPDELVEIAMALTLHELTGKEDIVFELEGHGRESLFDEVDVSRTVGWFTTMYPVCLNVSDLKPGVQIKSLKEQLRKVPNRGLGYGVLKYLSGKITDKIRRDIRLNYLGEFDNIFDNGMFSLSDWDSGEDHGNNSHLTCAVEVNGMIVSQKLKLSFIYSPDKFETATIQAFADLYIRYLRTIINHCTNMDFTDFTVSDFDMISLTQDELDGLFC